MKKYRTGFLIAMLLLAVGWHISFSGASLAQSTQFTLLWWTLDSGGGSSSGEQFAMESTIGQSDTGSMGGERFALNTGYRDAPGPTRDDDHFTYLPMILNSNSTLKGDSYEN